MILVTYRFIVSDISPCTFVVWGGYGFITSGQRLIDNDCSSPFAWMPYPGTHIPFNYTNWSPGQPNCWSCPEGRYESCAHYDSAYNFQWNDYDCHDAMCPICQFDYVIYM